MIDPSSDEGNAIYFFIEGQAAKKIYENVENAKIVNKYCNEENLIAKINNDFVCVLDKISKKYKCHFALRFKDMKVVNALSC